MSKTVLVVGGATGIGKQTTIVMGKKGWNVAFTSRNSARGESFQQELRNQGINATYYKLDVTNEEAVKDTIFSVIKEYGRMDSIVNNAGIGGAAPRFFADYSTENFREVIETNLMGVYYGMKHAIKHYLQAGGGNIINVSSIAGLNGLSLISLYVATKHAILGLTKTAAIEYADKNIRINAVAPGFCETDILNPARENGTFTDEDFAKAHPMNRIGQPIEVAYTIAFLASDEASFITGETVCVDGGYNAR